MSDPPGKKKMASQLILLLEVPVLPKELFPATFAQNGGPLSDDCETIRNGESRILMKATTSLRCSNTVPEPIAMETIKHFQKKCSSDISQGTDYIQHLQLQVNDLLDNLQATQRRQLRIQNLSDHFKPICSSVRRLPPEILSTIFRFSLPTNASPLNRAPLVFFHVSSLWRSVALGSQCLWTRLFLKFNRTSASKYDEISKFWFLHCQNQPRSLYYRYGTVNNVELQQWAEDLKTSSMLLRTLTCIDIHPQLLYPFLRLPSSDVPLLEVVRLSSSQRYNEVITVLETAPRLHVVHLDMSSSSFQITLPWSRLTWIKIHDPMDAEDWTVIFPQCLQLQYGSFEVCFPSLGNFGLASPVTLKHLEALFLTVEDDANLFRSYFQNLNLPGLQHLSLTGESFGIDSNMLYCDMRPYPNLVSLCLQGVYMEQDPASLFVAIPALECLALDITELDIRMISTPLHKTQEMLPNLSRLYLVMSYNDLILDPKALCSSITSRFHNGSSSFKSLAHVSLFLQRDEWRDDEEYDDEDNHLGFTAADKVEKASAMITNDPYFDGVDFQISLVDQSPQMAEIVEDIYCKLPQDY